MLFKRDYDIPDGWEAQMNTRDAHGNLPDPNKEEGALLNPLPVASLSVIHTGVAQEQNFSRRLIDAGVAEGWTTLSRGVIIMHTAEEDLTYTILRMPGRHCLYCDQHYPTDPSGSESRKHIAAAHPDATSPDPQWPHGYKVVEGYECVLDAAQHRRHESPAYATVSHARWKEKTGGAAEVMPVAVAREEHIEAARVAVEVAGAEMAEVEKPVDENIS